MLSKLEDEAARVIRTAIRDETLPAYPSTPQTNLTLFTLVQAARTRAAADETNAMADVFAKLILKDVPHLGEHLDKIEVCVTNAPLYGLGIAAESFIHAADLRYKLLCNRTAHPFITSDNPAVLYNQFLEPRKRTGSNVGLAVKGLQIFLPLGPRHVLMYFDADVYTVGGRRLSSQRVEVADPKDVRELNTLQAVNARETLFFNDAISPREIEATASKAAKYRPPELAEALVYRPAGGDPARDGSLVRLYNPDVRTRLALSFVRLTPQAERYDLGDRVIHHRDPVFVMAYRRYKTAVREGRYRVGQFERFVADLAGNG